MNYTIRGMHIGTSDMVKVGEEMEGTCSLFGGPNDTGVRMSEGLALVEWDDIPTAEWAPLFLRGKLGLARSLNPDALYCAMRWDYTMTSRKTLRTRTLVHVRHNGGSPVILRPVDWGPNIRTGRLIDMSPGAAFALGVKTDDLVSVTVVVAPDNATSCA